MSSSRSRPAAIAGAGVLCLVEVRTGGGYKMRKVGDCSGTKIPTRLWQKCTTPPTLAIPVVPAPALLDFNPPHPVSPYLIHHLRGVLEPLPHHPSGTEQAPCTAAHWTDNRSRMVHGGGGTTYPTCVQQAEESWWAHCLNLTSSPGPGASEAH
eukprot:768084-Hanusia_phi.AAC.1